MLSFLTKMQIIKAKIGIQNKKIVDLETSKSTDWSDLKGSEKLLLVQLIQMF